MNPKVDDFLADIDKWQDELSLLREIILSCQLKEEWKWKVPCYTFQGKNIIGINGFKNDCALSFFKGALLSDAKGLLLKPGENTRSGRWIKFSNIHKIRELESIIKEYIFEAIEVEKAGLKVDSKSKNESHILEELEAKFIELPAFKKAFEALTPGRQRGYFLHFSAPKQSKTRTSRIEKLIPKIMDGKGFHDCNCGFSKKYPRCDGSHRDIAK